MLSHSTSQSARESILFAPARQIQFLLLMLLTLPASGGDSIEMNLKAGLNGRAVTGEATEIEIRLFASSPINGELEILDSNGLTTLPVQLDERQEKTWWIPVTPRALRPVNIKLITTQGQVIEKAQGFEHSRTLLTLISSTIPVGVTTFSGHQQSSEIVPVILSTIALPHNTQAYASVGAIVTDAQSLSQLAQDQYHALSQYLNRCGILLVATTDKTALERVRNISGCSGHFVDTYEDLSEVTSALLSLNTKHPLKLPPAQELLSLQQTAFQQRMITSLSYYLGGYILFIALVTWRMKKTPYLLLLPALVAGSGALAWSGAGGHQLITWSEIMSGDDYARVSSVLQLGGDRQGRNSITLGPDIQLSDIGDSPQSSIRYQDDGAHRVLSVYTHLLTPHASKLASVTSYSAPFSLTLENGYPRVMLQAETFPAETRLLWRGRSYSVPMMVQGKSWQPVEATGNQPETAAEKLLNRRLSFGDPALLLPSSAGALDNSESDTQTMGWLVIRHDPARS